MIDLRTKNTILTLYKKGYSKSKIKRILGISRTTVIKYLREDEELNRELQETEAGSVEHHEIMGKIAGKPEYKGKNKTRSRRKYTPEIDKRIDELLEDEERKQREYSSTNARKLKRHIKDFYKVLVDEGYDISYSTLTLRMREKLKLRKDSYIRQHYGPGERLEYDFGERIVTIGGKHKKVYLAVFCDSRTNYRDFYVYPNSKKDVFIDSHVRFFKKVGIYQKVVYDNMSNVVKRFIGPNGRELTDTVLSLSNYYGFEVVLTNVRSPFEKGSVEKSVDIIAHNLFARRDVFDSWEDMMSYCLEYKKILNEGILLEADKKQFLPPKPPYESAVVNERKVDSYSFVHDDKKSYSVPEEYVGTWVTVKRYPYTVEIFYKGKLISKHNRIYDERKESIKIEHYEKTLLKKPGAVANSEALRQNSKLFELFNNNYSDNPREFLQILFDNKELMDTQELYDLLNTGRPLSKQEVSVGNIEQKSMDQLLNLSSLFNKGDKDE